MNLFIYIIAFPFSLIYLFLILCRNIGFDLKFFAVKKLPQKTISIGNLEVGGSGKTPLVRHVAKLLKQAGCKPAILIRGYRGGLAANDFVVLMGTEVLPDYNVKYPIFADEAIMLARDLVDVPVIVGRMRYYNAMKYWEYDNSITHWILDDGFSHRMIGRDLNLVLLTDKLLSRWYRFLIPAGRLREPFSQLKRANYLLLRGESNQAALSKLVTKYNIKIPLISISYKQTQPIQVEGEETSLIGKDIYLCLGVADPYRVRRQLLNQGISVKKSLFIADHKKFNFNQLVHEVRFLDAVVTTNKDYCRQKHEFSRLNRPVYIVDLEVTIDQSDFFYKIIKI